MFGRFHSTMMGNLACDVLLCNADEVCLLIKAIQTGKARAHKKHRFLYMYVTKVMHVLVSAVYQQCKVHAAAAYHPIPICRNRVLQQ